MNHDLTKQMNSYTLIVGKELSHLPDSKSWSEFLMVHFGVTYARCFAIDYKNHPNHQLMINGKLSDIMIHDLFSGRYPSTIDEFLNDFFMKTHEHRIGRRRIFIHTTDAVCFNRLIKNGEKYNNIELFQFVDGKLLPGIDLVENDFKM